MTTRTPVLELGPSTALGVDAVTETFAVLGKRGAGKTYFAMVLAEEMLGAGAQIVVLDPVSKWWGLRLKADGQGKAFEIPVLGGPRGDAPLSYQSGKIVAQLVATEGLSLVLDLLLFDSDGQRRTFVTDFARELFRLKSQARTASPLHVFLEEAEEFVPQVYEPGDAPMIGAIKRLFKLGRNFGIGGTLVSQRTADLNKRALSQTEYLVALRTKAPQDLKAIQGWIEHAGLDSIKATLDALATLPVGTGFLFGGDLKERFSIRAKRTLDTSKTPKVKGAVVKLELRQLDEQHLSRLRAAMQSADEEATASDPKRLHARIRDLERELVTARGNAQAAAHLLEAKSRQASPPAIRPEDLSRLESLAERLLAAQDRLAQAQQAMVLGLSLMTDELRPHHPPSNGHTKAAPIRPTPAPAPVRLSPPSAAPPPRPPSEAPSNGLTGPEQRILDACLRLTTALNHRQLDQVAVAFLAGYRPGGGAFNNPRGALHRKGLIDYTAGGMIELTGEGHTLATSSPRITSEGLQQAVLNRLSGPEARILVALFAAYPDALSNEDLARSAGYEPGGGAFNNPRGRLHTLGLIEYPERGRVRARDILFLSV